MAVAYLLQEAVVLRQKKKSRQETSAWGKSTSELEQISLESF